MAIDSSVTLSARIKERKWGPFGVNVHASSAATCMQHAIKKSNSRCRQAVELPLSLSSSQWTDKTGYINNVDKSRKMLQVISNNR
jgi:hypothetical protein